MKFLTKIKSIYLLAIVAILSFCMVLFPALPSFANATEGEEPESGAEVVLPEEGGETEGEEPEIVVPEETVEMGTGEVKIVLARSVVQNYTGEGAFADKANQWAIMFGAHITKAEYDNITQNDTALVKFGMLIGPTKLLESVEHTDKGIYADLVATGFESFAYVGSSKSDGQDLGKMFNEEGVAEYLGGIIYDQTKLGNNSIAFSALELTAIPFYMNANKASEATNIVVDYDVDNDVFGSAKSAVPRNVLVENYIRQDVGNETVPGDEVEIDISTIQTFVAQVNALTYKNDDAYICRSTNRVMVGETEQSELSPLEMATDGNITSTAFAGKRIDATGIVDGDDLLDETVVQSLPMYKEGVSGQGYFVIYGADSITVYVAKVAERVIMRFADTYTGNFSKFDDSTYMTEDGEFNYTNATAIDDTKDYLAQAVLVLTTNRKTINRRQYQSIFSFKTNTPQNIVAGSASTGSFSYQDSNAAMQLRFADRAYDGLYVLGAHIDMYPFTNTKNVTTGDYEYALDLGNGLHDGQPAYETVDKEGAPARAKIGRVEAAAGTGFIGTFDGRGFSMNMRSKDTKSSRMQGGILPPAFGATIKNVAFLSLGHSFARSGGTYSSVLSNGAGITTAARNTTFENIYAEVKDAKNYSADYNKGILMDIQNCELKNFVANVSLVNETVMGATISTTNATGQNGTGVGQGVTTAGVFNFRAFTDAYYDKTFVKSDGTKGAVRYATGEGQWISPYFRANISLDEIKEYFPNMINTNGEATWDLYNWAWNSSNKVAPLASDYNDMLNKEQANEFTGTTGQNVYAVGSSPLFVGYDYGDVLYVLNGTSYYGQQLTATNSATVFVNSDKLPKLTDGTTAEVGWRVVENTTTNEETGEETTTQSLVAPQSYKMSQLDDARFVFAEDTAYTLGEIIYKGKLYRHGATRMANLLGESSAADTLEVRFITQDGFYDCADATEMATYLTEENIKLFTDSGFWNVVDGVVSWKNA